MHKLKWVMDLMFKIYKQQLHTIKIHKNLL